MRVGLRLGGRGWSRLAALSVLAGLCGGLIFGQSTSSVNRDWETKAGGKVEFEVASVRPDDGPWRAPSFDISPDDSFSDPHGRFHADFWLLAYIDFAYKLWASPEEHRLMMAGLPAWVKDQNFAIEANAPLNATKDQYRLMMQALPAERFHLAVHFEQREMPVLALTLAKPGRTGPRLIPHAQGLACDAKPTADTFPPECYMFASTFKDGLSFEGSRGNTLQAIGAYLSTMGTNRGIDRTVVDRTGLSGLWDFTLGVDMTRRTDEHDAVVSSGPSLLEALREQLGLVLKPDKASVQVLVIEHIEPLTPN
jgi:uncharacterized protein (TIGR03435 family)